MEGKRVSQFEGDLKNLKYEREFSSTVANVCQLLVLDSH